MTVVAAVLAQLIHVLLMLAAAPTLTGVQLRIEAAFNGETGAPILQPWRDLRRLNRKNAPRIESASVVHDYAPVFCFAAIAAAMCLVPSFTLGMAFSPLADVLTLIALLALARAARALTRMDHGTAPGGIEAARFMRLGLFSDTALLLGIFALAALAGTTNLDTLVGLQREGLLQPAAASALAATALAAVAVSITPDQRVLAGASEPVERLTAALETLFWLNLIAALFLPVGIGQPGGDVIGWIVGLACWVIKVTVLAVALACCRRVMGSERPRATTELLAFSGLLALLAAVFAIFGTGTA